MSWQRPSAQAMALERHCFGCWTSVPELFQPSRKHQWEAGSFHTLANRWSYTPQPTCSIVRVCIGNDDCTSTMSWSVADGKTTRYGMNHASLSCLSTRLEHVRDIYPANRNQAFLELPLHVRGGKLPAHVPKKIDHSQCRTPPAPYSYVRFHCRHK